MTEQSQNTTQQDAANEPIEKRIYREAIAPALSLAGLNFTDDEIDLMLEGLTANLEMYEKARTVEIPNNVAPAFRFDPRPISVQAVRGTRRRPVQVLPAEILPLPDDLEEVAFWPVTQLAALIHSRQVTSLELTEMYLARLKRIGPKLECVITLTEDLARAQAKRADREIASGSYRGPLHGIPWGAKDLLATKGIATTWGAMPYKDQVPDADATVVSRLEDAGAVLVAKLTMGALAWGDVWFGGRTRSPWNSEEGSSGSSAGSGSATAAGLVGFAIGTETYGSIVSPSTACGLSGLRPTFGRVSRYGAMALCWTLDKIGPMCRSVEDCALVFDAIRGPDGADPSVIDADFVWPAHADWSALRIGYVESEFDAEHETKAQDDATLDVLHGLGAELIPMELPDLPADAMEIILWVEAAAAFDELTRTNRDDDLIRQSEDAWPNRFRMARTIPAVEYVQANRLRTLVMQRMAELMADIDVYVAPSLHTANLWLTNATGHPAVVVPNGWRENGLPSTITFTGRLFDEATVLAVAKQYQDATEFHLAHPAV
jgi:Asp-tRNA(Asn)/Glu-tRNA(Gln) amidotransferase A subunit family amidase